MYAPLYIIIYNNIHVGSLKSNSGYNILLLYYIYLGTADCDGEGGGELIRFALGYHFVTDGTTGRVHCDRVSLSPA